MKLELNRLVRQSLFRIVLKIILNLSEPPDRPSEKHMIHSRLPIEIQFLFLQFLQFFTVFLYMTVGTRQQEQEQDTVHLIVRW